MVTNIVRGLQSRTYKMVGFGPTMSPAPSPADRDAHDLTTLAELSPVVESAGLAEVVTTLAERLGFEFATLTLRDPESGEFKIEEQHGLATDGVRRGRYRPGEGVIGQVIEMVARFETMSLFALRWLL